MTRRYRIIETTGGQRTQVAYVAGRGRAEALANYASQAAMLSARIERVGYEGATLIYEGRLFVAAWQS